MPVKKVVKSKVKKSSARSDAARRSGSAAVRSRISRPAHQAESKKQRITRSLSERGQSGSKNTKTETSPRSVVSKSNRPAALSASVYDLKGKAIGRVSLPVEIFGVAENPKLISQAVRVYLANQRLGTASTKTRGEVQGSTRKIYRQKGTGRARHGAIRAPIFVHGGIALGPRPHDFSLTLPQKAKRLALFGALSAKLKDGEIKVINLEKITPKTKIIAKALKSLDLNGKTLLVTPGGMNDFKNVYLSTRNIEGVKIITATTLNTYDVLNNSGILFMKESIDVLKKHFLKGSN